ncbi:MAG TPA: MATE family efflux transporter [Defluviitaleaceae bacterium]|jgi:putative MATE family efflux protein|nr:MATE family efflux transporter [Defluviitaleaceae bacterium]
MKARYVIDMTEGNEVSLMIKFSLPMLIGNVFQQLYNMVDSIIVGKFVNANALASIGVTSSIGFLFFSVCLGLSVGVGIVISQYFGAREDKNVKIAIANSIYVIGITSIVISILAFVLARPILELMKTPAVILDDAVVYLKIISAGTLAVGAYNAISCILRALGDSRTPLFFLIVASIINVVLDLIFVLNFGWGVAGAAIATVISQAVAALGCVVFAVRTEYYFRLNKEDLKVNWDIIKECIKVGIPVSIQNSTIAVSLIALQNIVNRFGEVAVASYTTVSRIEQLIQQPFNSLGAAMSTYAAQNMGANKIERIKKGYHKTIIIIVIFSLAAFLGAQFGGATIMRLFVNEEDVIALGAKGIRITSYAYFFLGMIYITRGLLNGAGDTVYAMINGFVEVIGRVGFSSILYILPVFGVMSIWITTGLTWFITAMASIVRYKQGKWKTKSIVKQ